MRLRTRLVGAFLVVALPGVLVAGAAVGVLDRLLRAEIELRGAEVLKETRGILADERAEVERLVAAAARDPALDALARRGSDRGLERWAARAATALRLDLLAVVAEGDDGTPTTVSSAHLPSAVGAPARPPAPDLGPGSVRAGFAEVLVVEGNRLTEVPAWVAATAPPRGGRRFWVYGGRRLDHRLLGRIARMAHARLVIESRGEVLGTYPAPGRHPLPDLTDGVALPGLGDGPGARLAVAVDLRRLRSARRDVVIFSGIVVAAALVIALVAGAWLSARITEPIAALARVAERVGWGEVDLPRVVPRTRDEVGGLVRAFNRMTDELSASRGRIQRAERLAARVEVARRLAHEIRNPLSPIRLGMQNLRKAWAKQHPELGTILDESTRSVLDAVATLDRLVADYAEFARLPAPELRAVDPVAIVERVARLYEASVTVDLDRLRARGLPRVTADPDHLARALINLVKNALEAIEAAGVGHGARLDAWEEARGERRGVVLEVADDGPGMPPAVLDRARDVDFTTKVSGTGLGLPLVERTLAEHAGELGLASAPGEGTRARCWIPAEATPPS